MIDLICLSTRGAAPPLTLAVMDELIRRDKLGLCFISSKNELLKNFCEVSRKKLTCELQVPNKISSMFNPITFFKFLSVMRKKKITCNQKVLFILMHHPYTVIGLPFFRLMKYKIISTIHDFEPHEGDRRWLINIANWWICKQSHKVAFFSSEQKSKAVSKYDWIKSSAISLRHPSYTHYKILKNSTRSYDFIFFGRIEKYKGLNLLFSAFKKAKNFVPDITMVVAGKPRTSEDYFMPEISGVSYDIRYIPDEEVPQLLTSAKVVLLPYKAATQSGLFYLAENFSNFLVCTPCKSFVDQAADNNHVFLSDSFSAEDFALKMIEARSTWKEFNSTMIVETGITSEI